MPLPETAAGGEMMDSFAAKYTIIDWMAFPSGFAHLVLYGFTGVGRDCQCSL